MFNGLKECASKMQSLGAIKKVAILGTFTQNAEWWENRTDSAVAETE